MHCPECCLRLLLRCTPPSWHSVLPPWPPLLYLQAPQDYHR